MEAEIRVLLLLCLRVGGTGSNGREADPSTAPLCGFGRDGTFRKQECGDDPFGETGIRSKEQGETGLFRVEDGFEEQDADGGVDDVVAGELGDPGADVDGV